MNFTWLNRTFHIHRKHFALPQYPKISVDRREKYTVEWSACTISVASDIPFIAFNFHWTPVTHSFFLGSIPYRSVSFCCYCWCCPLSIVYNFIIYTCCFYSCMCVYKTNIMALRAFTSVGMTVNAWQKKYQHHSAWVIRYSVLVEHKNNKKSLSDLRLGILVLFPFWVE